ncbi:hypothetical protein GW17_00007756 [Ensete ventricosum]|nr:hypothetical protein GW17_00007756 [Ensete ventricosum]
MKKNTQKTLPEKKNKSSVEKRGVSRERERGRGEKGAQWANQHAINISSLIPCLSPRDLLPDRPPLPFHLSDLPCSFLQ